MQKITIAKIESNPTKDDKFTRTVITSEDGSEFNKLDDPALSALNMGTVIEAEVEVKGKYANIKEWKLIKAPVVQQARASQEGTPKVWKDNSASIETQVAFKGAVELMVAKIIDDKHPLFKQAISYAEGKLPQIALEPPGIETPKAKTPAPVEGSVPEITYQSVYKEIKELIAQDLWKQKDVLSTLDKFGGTGQTGLDRIKSLPMETLLQLSAKVNEVKKSHLAVAAKQMGAAEVIEPGDIPY